jgi:hypothetical protein
MTGISSHQQRCTFQFDRRRNPMRQAGIKPKLLFSRNDAIVTAREARSHDDFAIYATYRLMHGRFVGSLKVVRKTDSRLLFPFEGAPAIGPFDDKEQALRAATALGIQIVEADIANPET